MCHAFPTNDINGWRRPCVPNRDRAAKPGSSTAHGATMDNRLGIAVAFAVGVVTPLEVALIFLMLS